MYTNDLQQEVPRSFTNFTSDQTQGFNTVIFSSFYYVSYDMFVRQNDAVPKSRKNFKLLLFYSFNIIFFISHHRVNALCISITIDCLQVSFHFFQINPSIVNTGSVTCFTTTK